MTADDSSRDDPRRNRDGGASDGDAHSEQPFDEEAAWRLIVANYGDRPELGPDSDALAPTTPSPGQPTRPATGSPDRNLFDHSYLDALDANRSDSSRREHRDDDPRGEPSDPPIRRRDDEHFIPPEPPPVPRGTPARRLAWCGLFLPPLMMLAAVVFDWAFPSWVSLGLVAAFVGGFVFLVVTMPRDGGDGWGDGAVV